MVLLWINVSSILKIFVKLHLWLINPFGERKFLLFYLVEKLIVSSTLNLWAFSLGYWCLPPWMPFYLFPIYSINRVFLSHFLNKVIKFIRELWDQWNFLNHYLLDKILKWVGVEWGFSSCHLDHYTAKGPKVWEIAVHPIVFKKLRSHVVWSSRLIFAARVCLGVRGRSFLSWARLNPQVGKISDLLGQPKVT